MVAEMVLRIVVMVVMMVVGMGVMVVEVRKGEEGVGVV